MSEQPILFKDIIQESMNDLAFEVIGIIDNSEDDAPIEYVLEAVATVVENHVTGIQAPLVAMITEAVSNVLAEELGEDSVDVSEKKSDLPLEIPEDKLLGMLTSLRDYAFRFRDVENKTLQKFACTVLTLVSDNTPPEHELPPADEQSANAVAALFKIRGLVDSGPRNDVKSVIKQIIDAAIPGVSVPPEDVFSNVPVPIAEL